MINFALLVVGCGFVGVVTWATCVILFVGCLCMVDLLFTFVCLLVDGYWLLFTIVSDYWF